MAMSFIDSRTVFLLTGMMGGLMALILLSLRRIATSMAETVLRPVEEG